ncbi:MAG: type I restriction enzyme HsdR N-terminal domain-containing protein [Candidatus Saccharibacteria bacterium]|nr:type I restriction enzyme HsdR N-terminal domain-containing protein [Candidatus Saccharibacteria bacterium]MCY4010699.1 type I restriction enzyme HsdR N-terminal domain-containing protein [Candidatus Saccharibacteria bacterium]
MDKSIKHTEKCIREYRKKYLRDEHKDLDEASTRMMINHFLVDVLGYQELTDIKTEYRIKGAYADYVIEINKRQKIIVEVKARRLNLAPQHIRQACDYGANEGIDWVLLSNGCVFELYKIIFSKPVDNKKFFSWDLSDLAQIKSASEQIYLLSKKSIEKDHLDVAWQRYSELSTTKLAKILYQDRVVKMIKSQLRKATGLSFKDSEVYSALERVIRDEVEVDLPKPKLVK